MSRPVFWELIEANRRKSFLLFAALFAALVSLGAAVGYTVALEEGAWTGAAAAGLVWAMLSLVSYCWGDSILLSASGAKEVTHDVHPVLFNVVEEMRIASNLPANPKIYIIDDPSPNAFATGVRPERSAVAVTVGLLTRLKRDELQGVIAHEISHVYNRDVLFMTLAATTLGSIQLLSEMIWRGARSGGSSRRYRSGRASSSGAGVVVVLVIVVAILAPILAKLFYLAISRRREYLADASAARFTRYPEGLASALEKIEGAKIPMASADEVIAPMYIASPLSQKESALTALTSTHPPIEERVRILRAMSGASFSDYEKAYEGVRGAKERFLPASALESDAPAAVRPPAIEPEKDPANKTRALGDLMRAVNHFAFFNCMCGLKFKVPPGFQHPKVTCPRCGLVNELPFFGRIAETEPLAKGGKAPQKYARRSNGWESVLCQCGNLVQISPSFAALFITCPACKAKIEIE